MCIMAATRLGQSPEMDQSEIPNAEQILSALSVLSYLTSGVARWDSLEPSFEPKLFYFHWDTGIKLGGDLGEIVALGAKFRPKWDPGRSGSLPKKKKKNFLGRLIFILSPHKCKLW